MEGHTVLHGTLKKGVLDTVLHGVFRERRTGLDGNVEKVYWIAWHFGEGHTGLHDPVVCQRN